MLPWLGAVVVAAAARDEPRLVVAVEGGNAAAAAAAAVPLVEEGPQMWGFGLPSLFLNQIESP